MAGTTPITPIRLDPELALWAKNHAEAYGSNRSALIRELLLALRENRLSIQDKAPPQFINDGSSPQYPVVICLNPV